MGGLGSGRFLWRSGQLTTADCPSAQISIRAMFSIEERRKEVSVVIVAQDVALLRYGMTEDFVMLDYTPCRFGGARRWILCPSCNRRSAALYLCNSRFACRLCHRLRYPSQHQDHRARIRQRADAIRSRLGWPGGVLGPDLGRPKGMHLTTYHRLVDELKQLTANFLANLNAWVEEREAAICGDSPPPRG